MIYFNEHDPFCVEWLKNLYPDAIVDGRGIEEVRPEEVRNHRQCHWFGGIGGWSYALELCGLSETDGIWTGSAPCQPFSIAGKQKGVEDSRDLWPEFYRLVRECRPKYLFGEQVQNAIKHGWIDRVQSDLEKSGYTCWYVVLGAHSVGAPHIRQRLYWGAFDRLADSDSTLVRGIPRTREQPEHEQGLGVGGNLDESSCEGPYSKERGSVESGRSGSVGVVQDDTNCNGPSRGLRRGSGQGRKVVEGPIGLGSSTVFWNNYELLQCTDGFQRRVESGTFPLAHGIPWGLERVQSRLQELGTSPKETKRILRECRRFLGLASRNKKGQLKGYGNAIVPQVAAVFVKAFMETMEWDSNRSFVDKNPEDQKLSEAW